MPPYADPGPERIEKPVLLRVPDVFRSRHQPPDRNCRRYQQQNIASHFLAHCTNSFSSEYSLLISHFNKKSLSFQENQRKIRFHKIFIKKFHLSLSICNTLVYNNVDLKIITQTIDEEEIIMSYTEEVYERVVAQNPNEPEFHQAVKEVLDSLKVVIDKNEEEYRKLSILERLVEP